MSNFINADVKIDKFNEIIDIAKRTASDLKPAMAAIGNLVTKSVKSYKGSLRDEVKRKIFLGRGLDIFEPYGKYSVAASAATHRKCKECNIGFRRV